MGQAAANCTTNTTAKSVAAHRAAVDAGPVLVDLLNERTTKLPTRQDLGTPGSPLAPHHPGDQMQMMVQSFVHRLNPERR